MMKSLTRLLLALSCCAVLAHADDKKPDMQGMPEMGPAKEMATIAVLAGEWKMDMKFKMTPADTAWTSIPGEVVWTSVLGGTAMRMEVKSNMMGMPFEGVSYMTFHKEMKKWQSVWLDNMGSGMEMTTGTSDKDGHIVMTGENMMMGKKYNTRTTAIITSPNAYQWTYEMSNDGGKTWWTSIKASYTRK